MLRLCLFLKHVYFIAFHVHCVVCCIIWLMYVCDWFFIMVCLNGHELQTYAKTNIVWASYPTYQSMCQTCYWIVSKKNNVFQIDFNNVIKFDVWTINPHVKQIIEWHETCSMLLKFVLITFTNNRMPCTVGAYTIIHGLCINMCYVLWFPIVSIRRMWFMSWMCFELLVMYVMVCIPRLLCV